jgi:hypothetical protein
MTENERKVNTVLNLLGAVEEGTTVTSALQTAYDIGKNVPERRLRELTQAIQCFLRSDNDTTGFELDIAIEEARKYLVEGCVETVEKANYRIIMEE